MDPSFGTGREGATGRPNGGTRSGTTGVKATSIGMSSTTGPGTPLVAWRRASPTRSGTRCAAYARCAHLVIGPTTPIWSRRPCISPVSASPSGGELVITITPTESAAALLMPATALNRPGPAVTAATPDAPGGACIPVGRVDRCGLVPAIDQRDAEPSTAGQEGIQMSAMQREHHLDPGLAQRPGGKFTTVQRLIDMHRFPPECES